VHVCVCVFVCLFVGALAFRVGSITFLL
jgi:hypothetical protein